MALPLPHFLLPYQYSYHMLQPKQWITTKRVVKNPDHFKGNSGHQERQKQGQ